MSRRGEHRRTDAPGASDHGVSRNVKVLSAVSLAQDAGSEMAYPFLPRFITSTLGAPVVVIGIAEGLADAAAAVMKLVAGRIGRRHRRRWIAAGYGVATVGKAIVASAFAWPVVIAGRCVDRIGKGIRGVPRDALIADDTPAHARGRAFGFHRALDSLGAVLGPLLGLALFHLLGGRLRLTLAIALVPATISVLLVSLVRERPPIDLPSQPASPATGAEVTTSAAHRRPSPNPPAPTLPPGIWRVLAPLVVFGLANSTDALLLQHAADVGLGATQVVGAYVSFNVVYAALGYPAGRLADRVPHQRVYAAGLLVFAAVYMGLGLSTSTAAVWLLLPLYGSFAALTDGVGRAWLAELAPPAARTWVLGVHAATTGAAVLVAGLWSGLTWHAWGPAGRLPLTISGVMAAAVAAWLLTSSVRGPMSASAASR